jgi:coenzyme F420-reducing hydrogenase delta subunit
MNSQIINISLFYCSNSFSTEDIQYCTSKVEDVQIEAISLPCSGKVNLLYFLKAIETGSSGVIILTCKLGECKYLQGNLRAQKRIEAVDDLLDEAGLGRGYIKCIDLKEGSRSDALAKEIICFCNHVKTKVKSVKEIA